MICFACSMPILESFCGIPWIRKFIRVPCSQYGSKPSGCSVSHGFGYDDTADDYKVVRLDDTAEGCEVMWLDLYRSRSGIQLIV